ncbi:spermidine/putrescine transport system permease PotC [Mycoplasmopsis canis PG 14]|uniref:Spermidine/putrescine ABC transporter membrane protein n=1 Tax=Mycoplasmopsis canis TaxID=29555 RepID=A0A449AQ97_9BACT|nr:ABC transporter permease subunit [Mycoplasmopsis canis]AMD81297.1 spermidine/putrescine ABC transporter permease [Mycoplasmopsis canis PG 14]EIE40560.1 spermidine/putrescine transport system permease PotC [Mycoplasmopsis canis PG 14]VEU68729.1 spermidine/putrescine ABC transporter membrane protein [Mycoplasmopsis canis]
MSKFTSFLRSSYIYIILAFIYVPLVFGVIFSFNQPTPKGEFNPTWTGSTLNNWRSLFDAGRDLSLVNTLLLALIVSTLVIVLSLITVYSVYRQKNKLLKTTLSTTSNVPLINPDNITAIGLVLVFSAFFGIVSVDDEGFGRVIIGHTIMTLPYGILLMLPRSEKFNNNLYEASQDLGYSKFRSWIRTYLVYMLPSIITVLVVSSVFSFDDFIITRTVSNTSTLGTKLYEGAFEPWGLVLGSIVLFIVLISNIAYAIYKSKR